MANLEVFIINLFMMGVDSSVSESGHRSRDTTIIQCDGFTFEFKQHNIKLKQNDYLNQTKLTTTITVENISDEKIQEALEVIDDLCLLLSFVQLSPVYRDGYKINDIENRTSCSNIVINPINNIIEMHGKEIRCFIEQVYSTFKTLKSNRQLITVFGYLCEANRNPLALEAKLILHYVLIENLKHTFALEQGYKEKSGKYFHPEYPPQNHLCINKESYCFDENIGQYIHKKYGKCGSSEMTKRMFDSIGINRNNKIVKDSLVKRNKMIHEGILLPFGDINYSKQAMEDLRDVSDLLRQYLLTLLNYQGSYYLSRDRQGPSGLIT